MMIWRILLSAAVVFLAACNEPIDSNHGYPTAGDAGRFPGYRRAGVEWC